MVSVAGRLCAHGLDGLVDLHLDVGVHGVLEDLPERLPEAGAVHARHLAALQVGRGHAVVSRADRVAGEG